MNIITAERDPEKDLDLPVVDQRAKTAISQNFLENILNSNTQDDKNTISSATDNKYTFSSSPLQGMSDGEGGLERMSANKSITDSKTSKESLTNLFSNTYDILQ